MNKYNNPRLLNTVVSGTGMKHPMLPHVVVGDTANGFIRGDLMDANAIVELVNNIIGGAPDTLDTLKEAADRIAALEHDTQDYQVGDTLASKVWNTMRGLQAVVVGDEPAEELAIVLNWNNTVFDPHDEGRYGSLEIGVATSQKPGLMSTADKAALGAASAAAAQIPQIKQTIEDNELTVAAALNDLNSRVAEFEPDEDITRVFIWFASGSTVPFGNPCAFPGYIKGDELVIYGTLWYVRGFGSTDLFKGVFPTNLYYPIFCDMFGNVMYGGGSGLSGPPALIPNPVDGTVGASSENVMSSYYNAVVRRFPNVKKLSIKIVDHPFDPAEKLPKFNTYTHIYQNTSNSMGNNFVSNVEFTVNNPSENSQLSLLNSEFEILDMMIDDNLVETPSNTLPQSLSVGLHTIKATVYDKANGSFISPFPYNTGTSQYITSFSIPRGCLSIVNLSFQGFHGTSITIPDTILTIGTLAFSESPLLEEVIILGKHRVMGFLTNTTYNTIPTAAQSIFADCPNLRSIYVEDDLVNAYKQNNGWSQYQSIIKPISEYYETH